MADRWTYRVRGARCILCFIHKHKAPFYLCRNKLYTIHFSVVSSVGIQNFMEKANLSKDRVLSAWRGSKFSRDDYVKLNTSSVYVNQTRTRSDFRGTVH